MYVLFVRSRVRVSYTVFSFKGEGRRRGRAMKWVWEGRVVRWGGVKNSYLYSTDLILSYLLLPRFFTIYSSSIYSHLFFFLILFLLSSSLLSSVHLVSFHFFFYSVVVFTFFAQLSLFLLNYIILNDVCCNLNLVVTRQ